MKNFVVKILKTGKISFFGAVALVYISQNIIAQNVGITDAGSITPNYLLQLHKNSSGATSLLQLTNLTSTSGSTHGFTFDVDGSFNLNLNNREATSLGLNTSGSVRMTISSGGYVGINTSPVTNFQLKVSNSSATTGDATIYGEATGNAQTYGVYGSTTSTTANGSGIYGYASGATGAVNGVWGYAASSTAGSGVYGLGAAGVYGKTNLANGVGVFGDGTNGYGGWFTSPSSTIYGTCYSENSDMNGTAFYANNKAASGAGNYGDAIEAFTAQSGSAALWGQNTNATGTGLMASGNNVGTNFLAAGSGGAFTGSTYGLYARSNSTAAVQRAAIVAIAFTTTGVQRQTLVGAFSAAGTEYKIWGTAGATVSTSVQDLEGNWATLHAVETPEYYFSDYGEGQLDSGFAHITIDPILAKNICVSEKHPLRVFIQLEDDCNGVYVSNKTASGFDVVELKQGNSNAKFQWSIVCNVADMDGSKYSDLRFEPGPVIEKSCSKKDKPEDKTDLKK